MPHAVGNNSLRLFLSCCRCQICIKVKNMCRLIEYPGMLNAIRREPNGNNRRLKNVIVHIILKYFKGYHLYF